MKARRMLAAMAGGVSMFAFAAEEVPDTPGQTKVWDTPGERGKRVEVDYFADAHYEGGVAPDFTKPSATNVTINLAATPTEAKRLQEIADGVNERYYGLVTLAHRFTGQHQHRDVSARAGRRAVDAVQPLVDVDGLCAGADRPVLLRGLVRHHRHESRRVFDPLPAGVRGVYARRQPPFRDGRAERQGPFGRAPS